MTNIKPLIKRVGAYVIDLIIVLILGSLITSIPLFNKNMDEYQEIYDEYVVEYNEYTEYLTLLQESYKDEEISEEEYNKLMEVEAYKAKVTSKYEDNKISKGEYNEIVEDINTQFNEVVNSYNYILGKEGISNSIITLTITILYFGVIQYFLKGQTNGKKLLKLKVVSASNKKINVLNFILRSLIVNEVLLNVIGVLFLAFATKKVYLQADNILTIAISVVEAVIIFLVLTREDQRGLHDLLFNTKVISTENKTEETNKEDVKEPTEMTPVKKVTNKKSKTKKKIIDAEYKERSN